MPNNDRRYVYGALCTWHGPMSAVIKSPINGLPACPHCNGLLFELDSKEQWLEPIKRVDTQVEGYATFMEWVGTYGRCWPNYRHALVHYKTVTGIDIKV